MNEIKTSQYNGESPTNSQYFVLNLMEWLGIENSAFIRVLSKRTKQIYDLYIPAPMPHNRKIVDFAFIEQVIHLQNDLLFDLVSKQFEIVVDELEPPLTIGCVGNDIQTYISEKSMRLEIEILYEICECETDANCTSE